MMSTIYDSARGVSVCLMVALTGCAASTNAPVEAPSGTTTTSAVPTANGTYDRANDPGASNAGVGTTDVRPQPPLAVTTSAAVPAPPSADATLTDGQIAGIASRVDLAEIDAGLLAQSHGKSAKVQQFARHMVSAHKTAESKLNALLSAQGIQSASSAICDKLTNDTQAQKQSLMSRSGDGFDRPYLTAQLQDHQDVLELIDAKLLPQVQSAKLKTALEATRSMVVEHIQMAKDALASLPAP